MAPPAEHSSPGGLTPDGHPRLAAHLAHHVHATSGTRSGSSSINAARPKAIHSPPTDREVDLLREPAVELLSRGCSVGEAERILV